MGRNSSSRVHGPIVVHHVRKEACSHLVAVVSSEPEGLGCAVQHVPHQGMQLLPAAFQMDALLAAQVWLSIAHERPRGMMAAPKGSKARCGVSNNLLFVSYHGRTSSTVRGTMLGCTTGTRCFPHSFLGQRCTAGAARHNPKGLDRTSQNNVSRDSPNPRDQTCRQRCYFGRRLLDQTKHSGERAEPNKCLPHILGHLCNSPRSWYASPRLTGSHGLAPVRAHAGGARSGLPLFETTHRQRVGMATDNVDGGNWDCGLGKWGLPAGKREAGALSIAGVTLTSVPRTARSANLSGELIEAD